MTAPCGLCGGRRQVGDMRPDIEPHTHRCRALVCIHCYAAILLHPKRSKVVRYLAAFRLAGPAD